MSSTRVFVARLAGCAVFDPVGDRVGRVRDVLVVYRRNDPPRVIGLVVEVPGRRRVFVAEARIVDSSGEECARGTGTFLRSHIALAGLQGYSPA